MADDLEQYAKRIQHERAGWKQLQDIYERCALIAEKVWKDRLDKAALDQQRLAEAMRDRAQQVTVPQTVTGTDPKFQVKGSTADVFLPPTQGLVPAEIPVPLFTPRDRLQFIKEATVALLIEAGKRNLAATPVVMDDEREAIIRNLQYGNDMVLRLPDGAPHPGVGWVEATAKVEGASGFRFYVRSVVATPEPAKEPEQTPETAAIGA